MSFPSNATLLCAAAALCLAACSPKPDVDSDLVAGPEGGPIEAVEGSQVANPKISDQGSGETVQNGININRIRLPDMEKLPSDSELTTSGDSGKTGSGVIARPPSE